MGFSLDNDLMRLSAAGLLGLGLIAAGCGDDPVDETDTPVEATPTPTPTPTVTPTPTPTPTVTPTPTPEPVFFSVNIASPRNRQTVTLGSDADKTVVVTTTVTPVGFALAAPGECTAEQGDDCGHIYLWIDGADGAHDALGTSPIIEAHFADLGDPTGDHTITVGLRNDDGSAYLDAAGDAVIDEVAIVTIEALPTLEINSPLEGDTVAPANNEDNSLAVTVATTDLILAAVPEEGADPCDGEAYCGQLYLYIDGDACNLDGIDYNSVSDNATVIANFAGCENVEGAHAITVEFQDRSGAVISDAEGNPLSHTVNVTAELPEPGLTTDFPLDDDTVRVDLSNDKVVTFRYTSEDILIASTQACDNITAACGQVWATIDGGQGNRGDFDFNGYSNNENAGVDVSFGLLADPFGAHTVTLHLMDTTDEEGYQGTPILDLDGNPITSEVNVFVIDTDDASLAIINPTEIVPVTVSEGDTDLNVLYNVAAFDVGHPTGTTPPEGENNCGNEDDSDCGYVKVFFDGSEVATEAYANPVVVDLSGVAVPGDYTVKVELWAHGAGSVMMAQGQPVADEVNFSVEAPAEDN